MSDYLEKKKHPKQDPLVEPQQQQGVEQWDGFPDDDKVLDSIWAELRQRGVKADPVIKPSSVQQ